MAEEIVDHRVRQRIDAYFEGRLDGADARAVFDALASDAAAEAYFNRRRLMSRLDPGALSEQQRVARALGLPAIPPLRDGSGPER